MLWQAQPCSFPFSLPQHKRLGKYLSRRLCSIISPIIHTPMQKVSLTASGQLSVSSFIFVTLSAYTEAESHARSVAVCEEREHRGASLLFGSLHHREPSYSAKNAASKFGISKSTVHKDLSERLPLFNHSLYLQVKKILEQNKAERHIRGGIATRKKYKGE